MKCHFRLADGRRLAYREVGSGPPLVLLHGWSMSSAVFSEALEALADDFRLLVPDLRGHGDTEGGPGYALGDFAADLEEWLAALAPEEVSAVGWSLGGQVLLTLCSRNSVRFARVVLVGTTPRFTSGADWSSGLPPGQVRAMARDLKRNFPRSMGDFFDLQFADEELPPERYRRIVDFAVRRGCLPEPEVALASLQTLAEEDLRHLVPAVRVPALVTHGVEDRITPAGAGFYLADKLPLADMQLLEGVGHAPFLSRPEEQFRCWKEFLL